MFFPKWRRGKNIWDVWADVSIEELDLPSGIIRNLVGAGVLTIGQLLTMTQQDLKKIEMGRVYFGKGTIEKIQQALVAKGLPRIPEYVPLDKIKGENRR